jgi:hypothetical protein
MMSVMPCLQNKISMFLVVDFAQTGKCLLGLGHVPLLDRGTLAPTPKYSVKGEGIHG